MKGEAKLCISDRDEMEPTHALVVFKVLEQYYLAAEGAGFPLPAGFSSFFTYLGWRALPHHAFMQRVHRNVFELQIDVLKAIVAGKDEDDKRSVNNKLRLIQLAGEARGRRALGAWQHRAALQLRAREHAGALLSGGHSATHDRLRHSALRDTGGIAALPSGERLSPLDTFLDLLTAKASLNELDFNLIIEATLASVHQQTAQWYSGAAIRRTFVAAGHIPGSADCEGQPQRAGLQPNHRGNPRIRASANCSVNLYNGT
ncbi:Protein pigeon [Papilio machaon]|uniref:Protein pigeon n=1 Tax=Papilio machaon TaxID=76193 RepID=A0A0N1PG89_PAPMA|nr:Protein pigeon [Papilio machaon]